ncbi:uncharacterized protein LOC110608176 [Manihot esculenta]|uniref:Uncharacterized protein n=2 Tax=Manihot esculenta TaxID=3983 RepID=A0ACB7GQ45_MANES|nr:uncharacterized protein LOC110608176 [Manihot esculenta]KAG8642039.1 hypothetical protein MANES_12G060110v8 [Manihot esculenta]
MAGENKRSPSKSKDIILKAIEDLVSVNTLFIAAVFIGLAFADPQQRSLEINRPECNADMKVIKRLVVYEVVSFSCFLLSTMAAKSIKVYLHIFYPDDPDNDKKSVSTEPDKPRLDGKKVRLFDVKRGLIFAISITASVAGILFFALSIFFVIEIKLGKLSCGIHETRVASLTLLILVVISLLIYLPFMLIALVHCMIEP